MSEHPHTRGDSESREKEEAPQQGLMEAQEGDWSMVVNETNKRPREPAHVAEAHDATVGSVSSLHPGESTQDITHHTSKKTRRCTLHIEAVVNPSSTVNLGSLRQEIERFVRAVGQTNLMFTAGKLGISDAPQIIRDACSTVSIVDIDQDLSSRTEDTTAIETSVQGKTVAFWNVSRIKVHAYTLSDDELEIEELENADDEELTACETLSLPHRSIDGLWESLILPLSMKRNLLEYAYSALLFSDRCVSSHIISWNRVVLLHGQPGTGKTSLCRALAHKLAIRMGDRFPSGGHLLEIHAHSLFSKWFSESGKLVSKLFARIREMVEDDPDALVCVLVDEVESLAAARAGGGGSSGEPSDAIRAVNALLTSIDRLKRYPNVIIMTTTNITGSVDVAFVDRADIKQYIGLPILEARYEILRSCCVELIRVGIVSSIDETPSITNADSTSHGDASVTSIIPSFRDLNLGSREDRSSSSTTSRPLSESSDKLGTLLLESAKLADGLSGRSLRKVPFQSHALFIRSDEPISAHQFMEALRGGIEKEQAARRMIASDGRNTVDST
eukprot:scaffold20299_cov53-Attheya_sp.AAC.3